MFYNKATLWRGGASSGGFSYRYWRFQINSANGPSEYGGAAEVELRGSIGGADLSSPSSSVTSNAVSYPGYLLTNVVDNSRSTVWATTVNPPFPYNLTVDLGSQRSVVEVAFAPEVVARAPNSLSIYGSNDGSTFTLVRTFTGLSSGWSASVLRAFTL